MKKIRDIQLPDGLTSAAEKQVRNIIERFDKDKKLDKLDSIAIMLLASNLQTYMECEEKIQEEGRVHVNSKGRQTLNQHYLIQKYTQSFILDLLKQFGLTPAARGKIKDNPDSEEPSPLTQFLTRTAEDD